MAQRFYGSINLSKLLEAAHKQHSAFARAQKDGKPGDVYVSVTCWINDSTDQYGNDASIQVNPKKDSKDEKFYIGNLRKGEPSERTLQPTDLDGMPTDDDLPF